MTNGSYIVKAWVKSSGGQNKAVMELKQYGGSTVSVAIPTTSGSYTQISSTVSVTTGKIEIAFWSDANANNWINVDDIEIVAAFANPVANHGFESNTGQSPQSWTEWTDNNGADASYVEVGGSRGGSNKLTHWKASAYRVYTYQTITGIANGSYTVKAWVKSSGGQNKAAMDLKQYGGSTVSVAIPTTSGSYTQISSTVSVTTGKIEVGFWSDAKANNWINVDDVEIVSGCTGCRSAVSSQDVAEEVTEEERPEKDSFTVYPNPITPSSVISYLPKEDGAIDVSIVDVQGHLIRRVFNGLVKKELEYRFEIGLNDSAPGLYIATIASSTGVAHRKIWIGR
jgi:hypothetical protein